MLLAAVVDSEATWALTVPRLEDSEVTELLVDDRLVDSEPMLVEVAVDSDVTLLLVFDRPVDSEPVVVEVEVDSEETELLVEDTPVESELSEVEVDEDSAFSEVEVEVDSEATELENAPAALLRLLDSEATAALVWNSWLPFTASVLVAEIRPAARPVNCRSKPGAPMFTVPAGLLPAKLPKVMPPTVVELTGTAVVVIEPLPMATELSMFAMAFGPIATLSTPVAIESAPVELVWKYLMPFELMLSSASPTLLTFAVVPLAL